ncbi:hypothetical protein ONZ45_g17217 [Pleurotus djamor]|nr:hypothetical protein ONZ45_g17217 [Pleurotus djamor]
MSKFRTGHASDNGSIFPERGDVLKTGSKTAFEQDSFVIVGNIELVTSPRVTFLALCTDPTNAKGHGHLPLAAAPPPSSSSSLPPKRHLLYDSVTCLNDLRLRSNHSLDPPLLIEDVVSVITACLFYHWLRGGAIAWAVVLALYSIGGGVFLLMLGQYFFFTFPEWQIYGGIGIGVGVLAVITAFALSNRSYIWIRVAKFLWPFIIVICAVRAILMIVQLQRGKDKIAWQCSHGGQLWTESVDSGYETSAQLPGGFCATGFSSLNAAFIVSLLVDLVFQLYMYFLTWRFSKRLEHYSTMKGPFYGGYYNA